MGIPVTVAQRYEYDERIRYLEFLRELGADIRFETDTWICDGRTRYPYAGNHAVSIYFSRIPQAYRELVKYYAILRMLNGITVRTVKTELSGLATYTAFIVEQGIALSQVSGQTAGEFRRHLDKQGYATCTKSRIWSSVSVLHDSMRNFEQMPLKNPFYKNPYPSHEKKDEKYIPEYVAGQLDRAFYDEALPLELRTLYWVLRLIPSRIHEVLSMKEDCLKPYLGNHVLFIPTWKQNGGHKEPIPRSIHIINEGMGAYLIELLSAQQMAASELRDQLPEQQRGALFAYQRQIVRKNGRIDQTKSCGVLSWNVVSHRLRDICERFDIRDESGSRYIFTSHQLRHNGITDRLAAGFTIEQVAEMTGHHGSAMLWNSYAHLEQQDAMLNRQREIIQEPAGNPYVLFGGRILNMNDSMEKRLLRNLRAHRVRGGICCDVTNCKSDMWSCLDCAGFVPDAEQLAFYEEQLAAWESKALRFAAFPLIRQAAQKNTELFRIIIEKINAGDKKDG
jgi:site-specific recombinase XerD